MLPSFDVGASSRLLSQSVMEGRAPNVVHFRDTTARFMTVVEWRDIMGWYDKAIASILWLKQGYAKTAQRRSNIGLAAEQSFGRRLRFCSLFCDCWPRAVGVETFSS